QVHGMVLPAGAAEAIRKSLSDRLEVRARQSRLAEPEFLQQELRPRSVVCERLLAPAGIPRTARHPAGGDLGRQFRQEDRQAGTRLRGRASRSASAKGRIQDQAYG